MGGGKREREPARGESLETGVRARPLAGRCGVAAAPTDAAGVWAARAAGGARHLAGSSCPPLRPLWAPRGLEVGRRHLVPPARGRSENQPEGREGFGKLCSPLNSEAAGSLLTSPGLEFRVTAPSA